MAASRWRPGFRKQYAGQSMTQAGKIMGSVLMGTLRLQVVNDTEYKIADSPEVGPEVHVIVSRVGSGSLRIPLTKLTREELDALEQVIKFAFEEARPVVNERDKVAREAFDRGELIYDRSMHGTPSVVLGRRPGSEFDLKLREGHQADVPGDGDQLDSPGQSRGDASELAQPVEADQGSGNGSSADS